MNTLDIKKMAKQERLQAMEALWDALTHAAQETASPVWQEETLRARQAKIESGQASFVSLAEWRARRQ